MNTKLLSRAHRRRAKRGARKVRAIIRRFARPGATHWSDLTPRGTDLVWQAIMDLSRWARATGVSGAGARIIELAYTHNVVAGDDLVAVLDSIAETRGDA